MSQNIDQNDWQPEAFATPDKALKVVYQEKYGFEKTVYCMAIFYNSAIRQYKLVAPWIKDCTIEQENIIGKTITEISKSEMPAGIIL